MPDWRRTRPARRQKRARRRGRKGPSLHHLVVMRRHMGSETILTGFAATGSLWRQAEMSERRHKVTVLMLGGGGSIGSHTVMAPHEPGWPGVVDGRTGNATRRDNGG